MRTATLATLAALGCLAAPALAQAPQTVYVHLTYMKVAPGAEMDYVDLEREVWRPIHEEQRRRGELLNWNLYGVAFAPFETPYDYVAVTAFSDLDYLESDGWEDAFRAVHPDADYDDVIGRTQRAREIIHTEVWALLESATAEGETDLGGQYIAVNFMDVSAEGSAEYLATEREVWAPIHQVRASEGRMRGWGLYSIVFPRGETMNYRFGTADFFDSLADAADGITGGEIRRAHAGTTQEQIDAMMDRTDQARKIYKTEIWEWTDGLAPVDG